MSNRFFDFSVSIYNEPQVEEALLALQNHYGLNINLILYGCWYAVVGYGRLRSEDIKTLYENTALWHERIVKPLRALRQHVKSMPQRSWSLSLRKAILDVELFAEQTEQQLMEQTLMRTAKPNRTSVQKASDACCNIALTCKHNRVVISEPHRTFVQHILCACFPKASASDIARLCSQILVSKITVKSMPGQYQLNL